MPTPSNSNTCNSSPNFSNRCPSSTLLGVRHALGDAPIHNKLLPRDEPCPSLIRQERHHLRHVRRHTHPPCPVPRMVLCPQPSCYFSCRCPPTAAALLLSRCVDPAWQHHIDAYPPGCQAGGLGMRQAQQPRLGGRVALQQQQQQPRRRSVGGGMELEGVPRGKFWWWMVKGPGSRGRGRAARCVYVGW